MHCRATSKSTGPAVGPFAIPLHRAIADPGELEQQGEATMSTIARVPTSQRRNGRPSASGAVADEFMRLHATIALQRDAIARLTRRLNNQTSSNSKLRRQLIAATAGAPQP